jgi:hypothetical protein
VNRLRTVSTGLLCVSLMTLAGCGGDETTTATPASTPSAAATVASSAPAVTTAADKTLCESVKKAGEEMKTQLIDLFKSGEQPTPAAYKKILVSLSDRLTAAASSASDGAVSSAVRGFAAEATKAAATADPATAVDNPAFEKTATAITTACKPTGVKANF